MSKSGSTRPSSAALGGETTGSTPVPSSPPASESFLSEYDGTASVLDTSYGDGAAWEPPADASALNIVSWKLGVDAHVDDGVGKRGFNAISTVLSHPTKRANPLRASRKPLPPLGAPPLLPKPPTPAFYDGYLKTIAPLYETFVQSQAAASQPQAQSELDLQAKSVKVDLPSLDSIPEMFFDPNFDIANPSSWAELMDGAQSSDAPSSSKGKGRDDSVQDTLSTHLDNLERHLVHEITLRSSSFFSALANLQDLNSESSSCLHRISDLKNALGDVGGKQARKGLEIIDAQARLQALRVTEGGIKRVAELEEILRVTRGLADGGDWAGALGCVEDVVRWWERNGREPSEDEASTSHLPLNTLPALSNLPMSIPALTSNIASQLEGVLSATLLSLLSEREGEEPEADALRNAIGPMLGGLVRCGKASELAGVWRGAVTLCIREGLRQHLPVSQGQDESEVDRKPEAGGQSLAHKLQLMSHEDFVALCKKMYKSMLDRLRRVQWMGDEISSILSQHSNWTTLTLSDGPQGAASEGSAFDPTDVLTLACELANTRASKIVMVRQEQHASLPIEQYVEVFNETWTFVVATENLAKRMIASLRGVAASQTRSFLVSYHAQRLTKSARLVEEETWVQIDVPPATQHAVDLFVEAAVSDPAECFIPSQAANGTPNGATQGSTKLVKVEDKSFSVVKATAESLTLLAEYIAVVINLELVVTDVMSRVIEFLKSFNSRTCQVVLGAGAMRSAGLRNITAKHLALASQSLSVVVALIPYIREFIRRHLNPRQAVMLVEFDKLKRDYQEHQNEIHAKLVAIMADRLAVHVAELREIDWEATPAKDGPNSYALMLTKETATLHKVLSKYLSAQTVDDVMGQVIVASVTRLSEEYSAVELRSEEAKKRMLQDAALLAVRMRPLAESGATAASLEALVRDKTTPRKPEQARGMMRTPSGGPPQSTSPAPKSDEAADAPATTAERPDPQRQGSRGWREVGAMADADAPGSGAGSRVASPARSRSPVKSPLQREAVESPVPSGSSPGPEAKGPSAVASPELPALPTSPPLVVPTAAEDVEAVAPTTTEDAEAVAPTTTDGDAPAASTSADAVSEDKLETGPAEGEAQAAAPEKPAEPAPVDAPVAEEAKPEVDADVASSPPSKLADAPPSPPSKSDDAPPSPPSKPEDAAPPPPAKGDDASPQGDDKVAESTTSPEEKSEDSPPLPPKGDDASDPSPSVNDNQS